MFFLAFFWSLFTCKGVIRFRYYYLLNDLDIEFRQILKIFRKFFARDVIKGLNQHLEAVV